MFCMFLCLCVIFLYMKPVIVIHGGVGIMEFHKKKSKEVKEMLEKALKSGFGKLEDRKSALDAVESAVMVMEDCPLFNAGKGASFTIDGENELDALMMDGRSLDAGAVAAARTIKNPIHAARVVMEKSKFVLLSGKGADDFASQRGVKIVEPKYFVGKDRKNEYQKLNGKETKDLSTVGAVALDSQGNLAAATSTGGLMNKIFGRVGDSPIVGAGTYANNLQCAVSATGTGEHFIRSCAAFRVFALMEFSNLHLKKATNMALKSVTDLGGFGGMIAVDKNGEIAMSYSTEGMMRGYMRGRDDFDVKMFE